MFSLFWIISKTKKTVRFIWSNNVGAGNPAAQNAGSQKFIVPTGVLNAPVLLATKSFQLLLVP